MYPPIFELCSVDPDVAANLGSGANCRLSPAGEAPQDETRPYAVWLQVGGEPENYISDNPDMDTFTVQVDVFAKTVSAVRDAAKALRNVIEDHAHIISFSGETKDPDTDLYVYSFILDWFVDRDTVS